MDSEQLSIRITLRLANALQESTSSGWFASFARGAAGGLAYSIHGFPWRSLVDLVESASGGLYC